ncbi:hypothetical protein LX36DRAFT_446352 [Colletotrichum falcatum]|nr:hypothetical protein LX36DRAFT_446352 [Colletotrichum falcatum]
MVWLSAGSNEWGCVRLVSRIIWSKLSLTVHCKCSLGLSNVVRYVGTDVRGHLSLMSTTAGNSVLLLCSRTHVRCTKDYEYRQTGSEVGSPSWNVPPLALAVRNDWTREVGFRYWQREAR